MAIPITSRSRKLPVAELPVRHGSFFTRTADGRMPTREPLVANLPVRRGLPTVPSARSYPAGLPSGADTVATDSQRLRSNDPISKRRDARGVKLFGVSSSHVDVHADGFLARVLRGEA